MAGTQQEIDILRRQVSNLGARLQHMQESISESVTLAHLLLDSVPRLEQQLAAERMRERSVKPEDVLLTRAIMRANVLQMRLGEARTVLRRVADRYPLQVVLDYLAAVDQQLEAQP